MNSIPPPCMLAPLLPKKLHHSLRIKLKRLMTFPRGEGALDLCGLGLGDTGSALKALETKVSAIHTTSSLRPVRTASEPGPGRPRGAQRRSWWSQGRCPGSGPAPSRSARSARGAKKMKMLDFVQKYTAKIIRVSAVFQSASPFLLFLEMIIFLQNKTRKIKTMDSDPSPGTALYGFICVHWRCLETALGNPPSDRLQPSILVA